MKVLNKNFLGILFLSVLFLGFFSYKCHSAIIPQAGWSLRYVDSQELVGEDGAAVNSFDGNVNTFWHTQWYTYSPPHPHEIQIDLGGVYDISGFRYLPRQDGGVNGRIARYEFYVSSDGSYWGASVATGTFANNASEKEVLFSPVTGRFIRLRALSEVNGNPWTSMAELNLLGELSSGNQSPNVVIDTPVSNVTITVGQSVSFSGSGSDPDGDYPLSFLWTFGAGSGVPDSTQEDPGLKQFNSAGTFTVTFTATDAEGLADPTPATRTITVQGDAPTLIPQAGWSLRYVDSQELVGEDGAAVNSFDGNVNTMWHTQWYTYSPPHPHEIQIDLGGVYDISGFRYLPRQDGGINGRIAQYEFYVSSDGSYWGASVATGTFANSASEKEVLFSPVTGRFIRLRSLSEVNGNPWASMAELNLLNQGWNGIGDYYVAMGDSITEGYGDDLAYDDISSDGRNSGGGFEPVLNDLLTATLSYPHTVMNEGVAGTVSFDGASSIQAILEKYPWAQRFLIMYGTNDARPWFPVPSGLGLEPGDDDYPGSFKDNMQQIIDAINTDGRETCLSKAPIALGDGVESTPYPDPDTGPRSVLIKEFNEVIDELANDLSNQIDISPPDFYGYFNYYDPVTGKYRYENEYYDNLHPNGQGYRSMADQWFYALTH
jgi:lysophospholipase L1-like esterase/hemin uptake protein HemP